MRTMTIKAALPAALVLARSTLCFAIGRPAMLPLAGDDAMGKMSATGVTRRAVG